MDRMRCLITGKKRRGFNWQGTQEFRIYSLLCIKSTRALKEHILVFYSAHVFIYLSYIQSIHHDAYKNGSMLISTVLTGYLSSKFSNTVG